MNEKNSEALRKSYPNLYQKLIQFECHDGWYHLIDDLSRKLEPLVEKLNKRIPEDEYKFYAVQVKQKFGGLRFYMSWDSDEIDDLIMPAQEHSYKICEFCGNPGKIKKTPWLYCVCENCKG
jgi:hypothetical protein